ncbi:hypothetical protein MSG28_001321 [Choristoneura fumiferana]|uniref:Uncharacterized protein n=1 Tax=Choristoneura fumiferana TaxID=7141 RepID=A0ACC0KTQ0_CHOFU|nr:hypothetical protein MSG28_001321 [Choristoneura fumiferana]
MSSMFNFIKTFSARIAFRGFPKTKQCHNLVVRNCADKPKTDKASKAAVSKVILIVPPDIPKSGEIINVLAKNSIERGRDVGFPLLRFDVTSESIAKALEDLNLRKEWQLSYDIVPEEINDVEGSERSKQNANRPTNIHGNFIAVYTAFTRSGG